jgi:uncharacterized membrane protein YeaQ/YmgE (transglycosylase-associated protein family)
MAYPSVNGVPPVLRTVPGTFHGAYELIRHGIRRNRLGRAMNILIWLIMGGIIGWLASVIMRSQEGVLLNIVVGIVGALIGGWLISPMVGAATINQGDLSLAGLGVSLLGAIILLAIVNLFRGGGRTRL